MLRIQKYLADQGICSRREAEELIKRGLVSVNGTVIRIMGVQIDPAVDVVKVHQKAQKEIQNKTTVVVYKPRGIASSREQSEGTTIYDLLPQFEDLDIVGRLDKASEGLLMLSNDGVIARAVTGAHHGTEKEYVVRVREEINAGRIKSLHPGIMLRDGPTLPVETSFIDKHSFSIVLHEGRKHQIRRMCEFLRLTVVDLKRIRIGTVSLARMKPGDFRILTEAEVSKLKKR